jgi:hypothetical protein
MQWPECHPRRRRRTATGQTTPATSQIRLDPYCVFDRYFHGMDGKCAVKGKGSHG